MALRLPPEVRQAVLSLAPSGEALTGMGRAFLGGLAGVGFAFVVTVDSLSDGRRTYHSGGWRSYRRRPAGACTRPPSAPAR